MMVSDRFRVRPTPLALMQGGDLASLRKRLLDSTLTGATVLGFIVVLNGVLEAVRNWQIWLAGIYIVLYLGLILVAFVRKIPYTVRALGLIGLLLVMGLDAVFRQGGNGASIVWFGGSVMLAAIFLNTTPSLVVWAINTAPLLLVAYAFNEGYLPAPAGVPVGASPAVWLTTPLGFAVVTLILVRISNSIINTLDTNLQLARQTGEVLERQSNQLAQASRDLERRVNQLHTASEVSRYASTFFDQGTLLNRVSDLIRERFHLYYVGIFLVDEATRYAVLQAGTGEAGQAMLAANHRLAIGGQSMIGWCIANRSARIALDVGKDAVRFNNPNLPLTRSELALPLMANERVIGALTVQSDLPNAFDDNDISILQGMANAVAASIENARLVQELQSSLEEIKQLNQQSITNIWRERGQTNLAVEVKADKSAPMPENAEEIRVPLTLHDQEIGSVVLGRSDKSWDAAEWLLAQTVASQAAQAMENARLMHEMRRRSQQEAIIGAINSRVRSSLDVEMVLRAAADEIYRKLALGDVSITFAPEVEEETVISAGEAEA